MKVDITHLLQILNFSSPFTRFEIKNSLCRPIMVANNILNLEPSSSPPPPPLPQTFLHFYGPEFTDLIVLQKSLKDSSVLEQL